MKKSLMFLFTLLISRTAFGVGNQSNAFKISDIQYLATYDSFWNFTPNFSDEFSNYCSPDERGAYASNFGDKFFPSYNNNCSSLNGSVLRADSYQIGDNSFKYRDECYFNWIRYEYNYGGPGITFKWVIDSEKMENSQYSEWQGFLQTFPDGNQYLMDEVFFRHDSIIFRNSQTKKTFQRLGKYGLFNRIVVANPYSSLNGINNLWLIDFEDGEAWSAKVSREVAAQFMLGQIPVSPTVLQAQNWENSYTITEGGTSFFPSGFDGFQAKCGTQTTVYRNDIGSDFSDGFYLSVNSGYTYTLDMSIGNPDFTTTGTVSITTGDTQSIIYNDCFGRYNTVSMVSNDWYACKSSSISNSEMADVIEYIVNYSGDNSLLPSDITSVLDCQSLILDARWLYSLYSGEYNSLIQIARSSSSVPNGVDVEGYCGTRPSESEDSVWSNLINMLGLGDDGWFQKTKDYLDNLIYDTVFTNLRNPISTTFEEGFSKYGNQQCHAPIVETSYGNIVLYFFGAVLIFVFLIFL